MSEVKPGESAGSVSGESAETVESDQNQVAEIVVDRSPEELARKLKAYANENEQRRKAEKALKKDLEDAKTKLKTAEEIKLKEQGQWQAAYEKSKKDLEDVESKMKKMHTTFAYKTVTSQIKEHAIRQGCTDADAMITLATAKGLLDSVEPDEDFNIPGDAIKNIVSEAQKSMSFLFGKSAPTIRDGRPTIKPDTRVGLDSIPLKDRATKLAELLTKERR